MKLKTKYNILKYKNYMPNFLLDKVKYELGIYNDFSNNKKYQCIQDIFENNFNIDRFNLLSKKNKIFVLNIYKDHHPREALELYILNDLKCFERELLTNYFCSKLDKKVITFFEKLKFGKYNLYNLNLKYGKYKVTRDFFIYDPSVVLDFIEEGLVSIIFTTYNEYDQIEMSLTSILRQSYFNTEIILVDDNSDDETISKFIETAEKHKYTDYKIIKNDKNYGTYVSKNIGIKHASGKYITFHDADDYSLNTKISDLVLAIYWNYIASISDLIKINPNEYIVDHKIYPLQRLSNISLMIKRSVIDDIGYFRNSRFGNDSEFLERIKLYYGENRIKRVRKLHMLSYLNEGSVSNNKENGVFNKNYNKARLEHWADFRYDHINHLNNLNDLYVPFNIEDYQFKEISNNLPKDSNIKKNQIKEISK